MIFSDRLLKEAVRKQGKSGKPAIMKEDVFLYSPDLFSVFFYILKVDTKFRRIEIKEASHDTENKNS